MTSHKDDQTTPAPRAGDRIAPRAGDRIAKLLARAGVASRREIERMIEDGRIALNGVAIDTPATILRSLAGVTVDGNPVAAPEPTRLFLYNKPPGLLVTERDPKGRPTIYDRLPGWLPRVVPVGRLDLATEGLLLLTTDGGFKRQLELPSTGVERTYRARAYGDITQAQLEELSEGIEIEGIRYGSIDANLERRTGANVWIELTLTEGKNREVRRVLEHLGLQVSRLIRVRYGPFILGELPAGEVGEVKQHEAVAFRKTLKGGAPDEPAAAAPRAGFRTPPTTDRTRRAVTRPRDDDRPARPGAPARAGTRDDRPPRASAPGRSFDKPRTDRPDRYADAERPTRAPRGAPGRPARGDARPTGRSFDKPRTDRPDRYADTDRPTRTPRGAPGAGGRSGRPARGAPQTSTTRTEGRKGAPARADRYADPERPARPPRGTGGSPGKPRGTGGGAGRPGDRKGPPPSGGRGAPKGRR